ncbi:MAG: tetratricopeptide repeat protein [Pseudomonadota bacterium]
MLNPFAESGASQQAPIPEPQDPVLLNYLGGLEGLRQGEFGAAADAFNQGLLVAPDDQRLLLARAVAYLLSERFEAAKQDLFRLPQQNRHVQVWNYARSVMTKDMTGLPSVPSNMVQSYQEVACNSDGAFVPGHVIQGDNTYGTDYASHVIYEVARTYARITCGHSVNRSEVDQLLHSAGRWFAHLNMARPELVAYQLQTANHLLSEGDLPGAQNYAQFAALSGSSAPEVVDLIARIDLAAGRSVSARRGFTRALAMGSRTTDTTMGRTIAQLRIGDTQAAEADLSRVRSRDSNAYERWEDEVEDAEDVAPEQADTDSAELIQALASATREVRSEQELNVLAQSVQQHFESKRLRFDEIYEATLRKLLEAAYSDTDNPEHWIAASRYLLSEVELRGESVEKGRALQPYRHQSSATQELHRALKWADQAISLKPELTTALMLRAEILNQLGNTVEAESIAQRVLQIDPDDAQAAVLFAMFRAQRAANLRSAAAALRAETCSSTSSIEHRHDGVYRVTRRTCTPPTQGELNQARQYDREADRLFGQSQRVMNHALEVSRGTYQGFLLQADIALWQRNFSAAATALRGAVNLDPNDKRAHQGLVLILPRIGEHEAAAQHQVIVNRDLQTTAAPLLKYARQLIEQRQFSTAGPVLERALTLDPQDARVPAYLGVVYDRLNRTSEAQAAYQLALAMETARVDMDGGTNLPRSIEDYGLYLHVTARLARLLQRKGDHSRAVSVSQQAIEYNAWRAGWRSVHMVTGVLPDFDLPVPNGATLVAQMMNFIAKAAQANGDLEEAKQRFNYVINLGPNPEIPNIQSADGSSNFAGYAGEPVAEAMLGLMEIHIAQGNNEAAQKAMSTLGFVQKSQKTSQQIQQLERQLDYAQRYQEADTYQTVRLSSRDLERIKSTLKTHRALIGTWTYTPTAEWRLATPGGQFQFHQDGRYQFTQQGRLVEQGYWGAEGNYQPIEMLTLVTEEGVTHTRYPEQQNKDHFMVTEMTGAKFDLVREQ